MLGSAWENPLDPQEDLLDLGGISFYLKRSLGPWMILLGPLCFSWSLERHKQKSPFGKVNTKHIPLEFSEAFSFFCNKISNYFKSSSFGFQSEFSFGSGGLSCHFAPRDAPPGLERSWAQFV